MKWLLSLSIGLNLVLAYLLWSVPAPKPLVSETHSNPVDAQLVAPPQAIFKAIPDRPESPPPAPAPTSALTEKTSEEANRPENRVRDLKLAIVKNPKDAALYRELSKAYLETLHDPARAQQALETSLRLDPKNPGTLHELIGVYLSQPEPKNATAFLENFIKENPDSSTARFAIGDYWMAKENPRAAIAHLEVAYQDPNASPDVAMLLSDAYVKSGKAAQAADLLQKLYQEKEQNMSSSKGDMEVLTKQRDEIAFSLIRAQMAAGDRAAAEKTLRDLGPRPNDARVQQLSEMLSGQ